MLSRLSVQNSSQSQLGGKLVAVGDVNGTVTLLELCDSLAVQQNAERKAMDLMFEREMKQEKNLEARERDIRRLKSLAEQTTGNPAMVSVKDSQDNKDERMEALLRKVSLTLQNLLILPLISSYIYLISSFTSYLRPILPPLLYPYRWMPTSCPASRTPRTRRARSRTRGTEGRAKRLPILYYTTNICIHCVYMYK